MSNKQKTDYEDWRESKFDLGGEPDMDEPEITVPDINVPDIELPPEMSIPEEAIERIKKFYTFFIGSYLHWPSRLEIEVEPVSGGLIISANPYPADYGKISGKQGINIMAMETITAVIAKHLRIPLKFELVGGDRKDPRRQETRSYVPDPLWSKHRIAPIIDAVLKMAGKEYISLQLKKDPRRDDQYFFQLISPNIRDEGFIAALSLFVTAIGRTQGVQLTEPSKDREAAKWR